MSIDRKRIPFGGWQTKVIYEGAYFTREIRLGLIPGSLGVRGARMIAGKLASIYGDGTFTFFRYNSWYNPRWRKVCRVKVRGGVPR